MLVTLTSNILQTDFMRQAENGSMYSDKIKDIVKTISMKNLLKDMFFNTNTCMIKIIEKNQTFFL